MMVDDGHVGVWDGAGDGGCIGGSGVGAFDAQ